MFLLSKKYIKNVFGNETYKKIRDFYYRLKIFFRTPSLCSYAQLGEDLILYYVMQMFDIKKPSYLDIGAFHAKRLSNTYFFYKRGSRGVLVEPDPVLFRDLKKQRKQDVCLNVGVGCSSKKEADFYISSENGLNTFSHIEAEKRQGAVSINRIMKVPVTTINNILRNSCKVCPDIVSIDVEGLDEEIVKSIDFTTYRPAAFCIETIRFIDQYKNSSITDFMLSQNYKIFADTNVNTIYIDAERWNQWFKKFSNVNT